MDERNRSRLRDSAGSGRQEVPAKKFPAATRPGMGKDRAELLKSIDRSFGGFP